MRRIGLIHPGAIQICGAAARSNNHAVLWASAERTASTRGRGHAGRSLKMPVQSAKLSEPGDLAVGITLTMPPIGRQGGSRILASPACMLTVMPVRRRTRVVPSASSKRLGIVRLIAVFWRPSLDTRGAFHGVYL